MKIDKRTMGAVIFASLVLLLGLYPGIAADKETHEEKFEKTVSLAKDGRVTLSNISGDVEVKTWGQGQVKIDAMKVSKASSLSKAQENAKKVTIEVSEGADAVRIETRYPEGKFRWGGDSLNVSVHYKLWIPEMASLKVKSVSGDISAEKVGGTLELGAVSGDIDVTKAGRGAECSSVSGDVRLVEITGDVHLKSVSGEIDVEQVKGSVEAESVSGKILLKGVSMAKTVKAKTVSGDIRYLGGILPEGRCTLKTHSGDIEVEIPVDSGFDFEAQTFSGDIRSDFQLEVTGKFSPREIRGVVNKGGASLSLSTFSGDIKLRKS